MHREDADFNNIMRGYRWVLSSSTVIIIIMRATTIIDGIGFPASIEVGDRSQTPDISPSYFGQE